MIARIVIGSSFGDEGKGLLVDHLCAQGAGMVVRYNGSCQAGHTVITPDNERHIFRHIGSGTFCDVPTFLSQYFVCNPILFFEERAQLIKLGFHPEVYAHPDCLITTFADMMINQIKEDTRATKRHGSCGIGFHETLTRSQVPELKITMGDLWNGASRLPDQLAEICGKYAQFRIGSKIESVGIIESFVECCREFANEIHPLGIGQCKNPVFEGAQGLLLDQDNKEFFPHVTHSKTGMHNVRILCAQAGITQQEIYYVSRTYLTRHGAGPLPGEDNSLSYADDTNHPTRYQGALRFAPLRMDALRARCRTDAGSDDYRLVLTHCDQKEPDGEADYYSCGPTRDDITNKHPQPVVNSEP